MAVAVHCPGIVAQGSLALTLLACRVLAMTVGLEASTALQYLTPGCTAMLAAALHWMIRGQKQDC